jgi:hypothetical protein
MHNAISQHLTLISLNKNQVLTKKIDRSILDRFSQPAGYNKVTQTDILNHLKAPETDE